MGVARPSTNAGLVRRPRLLSPCTGVILNAMTNGFRGSALLAVALNFFSLAQAAILPMRLPPVGAYSAGIGYASLAVFDDPSMVYWNPAGLAVANIGLVQFSLASHTGALAGSWSALIASGNSGSDSRFGLGLIRRHSVNFAGEFTSFECIAPLSYVGPDRTVPIGFSMKFQTENYGSRWVYTMGLDAGAAYITRDKGLTVAVSTKNVFGGRLQAFPHESWIGAALGSDTTALRFSIQARFDRPLHYNYMSQNYSIGGRLLASQTMPQLRMGVIHGEGKLRYSAGIGYAAPRSSGRFDVAVIFDPKNSGDRTYFLTYGISSQPGSPTMTGSSQW